MPLPSPQQVTASVPLGRLDPFSNPSPTADAVGSATGSAAQGGAPGSAPAGQRASGPGTTRPSASLPADFVFSGVIASRGVAEALVQSGGQSGPVKVGEVGGVRLPWLPAGWKVTAIDAQQGRLTLQRGAVVRVVRMS